MGAQAASKRYQASYIGPDRERHKAPSTPAERPEVEGLVDGVWYPGELRMWTRRRSRRRLNQYGSEKRAELTRAAPKSTRH